MLNFTDNWDKMEEPTYFDTFSKNDQIEFDVQELINDIIIPDLTKELKDMLHDGIRRVYDDSDRKAFDYSYGKLKANKEWNDWLKKRWQQWEELDLDPQEYWTWNNQYENAHPRPEIKKGDQLAAYKSWARKNNLIVVRKTFFEPVDNIIITDAVATFDSNGRCYYVLNTEDFFELVTNQAKNGSLNINEYFESQKELKEQLKRAFKKITNGAFKDYFLDIFGPLNEAS